MERNGQWVSRKSRFPGQADLVRARLPKVEAKLRSFALQSSRVTRPQQSGCSKGSQCAALFFYADSSAQKAYFLNSARPFISAPTAIRLHRREAVTIEPGQIQFIIFQIAFDSNAFNPVLLFNQLNDSS
jgi:hypothetical protein